MNIIALLMALMLFVSGTRLTHFNRFPFPCIPGIKNIPVCTSGPDEPPTPLGCCIPSKLPRDSDESESRFETVSAARPSEDDSE